MKYLWEHQYTSEITELPIDPFPRGMPVGLGLSASSEDVGTDHLAHKCKCGKTPDDHDASAKRTRIWRSVIWSYQESEKCPRSAFVTILVWAKIVAFTVSLAKAAKKRYVRNLKLNRVKKSDSCIYGTSYMSWRTFFFLRYTRSRLAVTPVNSKLYVVHPFSTSLAERQGTACASNQILKPTLLVPFIT